MNTLLAQAKSRFKKGDLFLTATKNIKTPLLVNLLLVSENYPNTIVNENGGVIVTENENGEMIWAEKVNKN